MSTHAHDEAARARARSAPREALSVEAGAGTGKTTLMVDRVCGGLRSGELVIDRIAAISFTLASAAELRARLRERLTELLATAHEPDERDRLVAALRGLPAARISTVHSFCSRLLRDHALGIGLDPDFSSPGDDEQDTLFDEAWSEWLTRVDGPDADAVREALSWGASMENLTSAARALYGNPDCGVDPPVGAPQPDAESIWLHLCDSFDVARDALQAIARDGDDELLVTVTEVARRLAALSPLPLDARMKWLAVRTEEDGVALRPWHGNRGKKTSYRDPARFTEIKTGLSALAKSELPPLIAAWFAPIAQRTGQALVRFRDAARDARLAAGTIGFVDQIQELAVALRDDSVRDAVRGRFDALLIDEYQDIDPVMAQIFARLTEDGAGPALFLVGDPKQSIYRFRRADAATFREAAERFRRDERLEQISVNYRAPRELLEPLNVVTRGVLTRSHSDRVPQAAPQDLLAPLDAPPAPDAGIVLAQYVAPGGRDIDAWMAAEAEAIAAALAELRRDGGVDVGSMAVLFRRGSKVHILCEALERHGLPWRLGRSRDFFGRAEIAELTHVVSAIADPREPFHVASALRSRLLGIGDDALAAHVAQGGRLDALRPGASGRDDVRAALARLAAWHAAAATTAPPRLIEQVLAATRFVEVLERATADGERAAANVRLLVERARAQWRDGLSDIQQFAAWMRASMTTDERQASEAPAAPEDPRVVLQTIHAAKGLQWPVVAIFDTWSAPVRRGSTAIDRTAQVLEFRLAQHMRTPGFDALWEDEKLHLCSELGRLAYVALTRARRTLVLPLPATDVPLKGMADLIAGADPVAAWRAAVRDTGASGVPGVVARAPVDPAGLPEAPASQQPAGDPAAAHAARDAFAAQRAALHDAADRDLVLTPSALHPVVPRAAQTAAPPPGDAADAGRAIGSAVHAAMERILLADPAQAAAIAQQAVDAAGLTGAPAEAALELARRGAESALVARARAAVRRMPELPFAWQVPFGELEPDARALLAASLAADERPTPRDGDTVTVEGIADLVFEDGGGRLVLLDYKTDAWREPADLDRLAARYAPQLALYRAALRAILGREVDETRLLFLGGPGAVERAL